MGYPIIIALLVGLAGSIFGGVEHSRAGTYKARLEANETQLSATADRLAEQNAAVEKLKAEGDAAQKRADLAALDASMARTEAQQKIAEKIQKAVVPHDCLGALEWARKEANRRMQ